MSESTSTSSTSDEVGGMGPARATRATASHRAKTVAGRCSSTTLAGLPCPTRPMTGKDRCRHHEAAHDPVLALQVAQERTRGGRMSATRGGVEFPAADLSSVEGCHQVLQSTVDAVRRGQVTPSVGQATATLVQTAIRLAEVALSKELRRLEQIVAERLPGGRR